MPQSKRMRTVIVLIALLLPGCVKTAYGPALDRALAICRQEAREAIGSGNTFTQAIDVYENCKIREGAY